MQRTCFPTQGVQQHALYQHWTALNTQRQARNTGTRLHREDRMRFGEPTVGPEFHYSSPRVRVEASGSALPDNVFRNSIVHTAQL